ncbi:bifunctional diaminohydroxyphosphoribosylaminopyrimidine deaminase/5-amino-6-(5-phosphoribosylamino)uracil reductase RibD [Rubrivirga litoralis]|uniref:Riboflavin biosynthesis protein RibD n=1 Tax=Rubrivirga litoralis TaxID=3075598 RepID=A0ABU3BPQ8_9BACT|nr:bifunctional diaminohydroxyphosphoribosylaminopyrimidine deaminase/5-amino-6-(5-phosphoribosylamino)uracil reductase RibD [Rubrivirga sp. F394]MDT0631267.1 bifunctional diaminohydroxyphosphoribosylaminopyrimidine deaminase/5-amino-6-(5-phosphoribosylamino)uracil reductase RibD [Rubrivirga sp. F394]
MTTDDDRWMDRALALAARGAGAVSPNPLVGAVVVSPGGAVWGEGWHGAWGGPHAEVWAVRDAERNGYGDRLTEATLYVTLEPCSHTGKTPPCTSLVLDRGFRRVVVAHEDPFPAVVGRGVRRLRAAGVDVAVGVRERAARRLNEAFLTHVRTGRPLVTLKTAATLDGQVAAASGDSRWVTGRPARALVHRMRADADAVLVGAGTAHADDPALTVRAAPLGPGQRQPLRVVLDRAGALPPGLALFTDGAAPTVALVSDGAAPPYADALRRAGGAVLRVPERGGHLDLGAALDALGGGADLPNGVRPVQSLLVEAGPGLATALLAADLADRVCWFVAPKLLGAGTPALGSLGAGRMADALAFEDAVWETVGDDVLLRGYRRAV